MFSSSFHSLLRNLPIAIFLSMAVVTAVYLLANIAYFTLLSPAEMLSTPAVAILFAEKAYGPWAWVIPVSVALSCFGTFNGILLTSSRLFFVGGREGHMPEVFTMLQLDYKTPVPAIVFTSALSIVYLAISDNIFALMNYLSICGWLAVGIAVFCVLWLRWKRPDLPRPYRVNLAFPIIYCLATVYLVLVPLYNEPVTTGIGLLIILTGIPVYFVFIYWHGKPRVINQLMESLTWNTQKLTMCVPEAK